MSNLMCELVTMLHKGLDFTLDTCGLTLVIYFGTPEDSILLHKPCTNAHFLKNPVLLERPGCVLVF